VQRLDQLNPKRLKHVRGVLTDIDDTLSTAGKLTAEAFDALWRLHDAKLCVVVVTGRPAGWCDHIARFWPVDAVIGENGGFYIYHDGARLQRRYVHDEAQRQSFRQRLTSVRQTILAEVPGTAVASDQHYRECDLAIDFCEDVPPLSLEKAQHIQALFEQAGAHAKISSIHVNGWYGDFDKLSTAQLWADERLNLDLDAQRERFVYCGDSPNDEPMFAFYPLSFAVANVKPFLPQMTHKPAYVTSAACGAGFREMVDTLLAASLSGAAR
jgi:HAD superfamily hydrolase (TIGR01484 family)